MAGDWVKWVKGLENKPEVVRMSGQLGRSRLEVATMCMVLWGWADDNIPEESIAESGSAFVTLSPSDGDNMAFIDAVVGTPRFADSMSRVGWLRFRDERVEFPNFGRHNGETAKTRARNAKNQKKKRCNPKDKKTPDAGGSGHPEPNDVTEMSPAHGDKTVTREEKRRDVIHTHTPREGPSGVSRRPMSESYPAADAAIVCVEIDGDLLHYDDDRLRWEAEFIRLWNAASGNAKHSGHSLSVVHQNLLRARLSDPGWYWKRALAKFPLWTETGWKPGLTWFLEQASVQNILEGRHDQRQPKQAGLFGDRQQADPTRVRTGKTSDAIAAAMAQAAAARSGGGEAG